MTLVQRRREKKNPQSEEDSDYGFHYPVGLVESLYWERYNSSGASYPDEGGMLDQDQPLQNDLATYGWLIGLAEAILDKDKEAQELIAAQMGK